MVQKLNKLIMKVLLLKIHIAFNTKNVSLIVKVKSKSLNGIFRRRFIGRV